MKSAKDDEIIERPRPYTYFEQSLISKVHHYYLSKGIEGPEHYVEMIHQIRAAGPSDVVYVHLNTPGGRLDTGVQLINAMRSSEAHVICGLEADAHSLGTLIFLAADEFVVHDNCMMMFHNYSSGVWGKGNEQEAQVVATSKWFDELARDIYTPFLTHEEVDSILKGEDLWLRTEEIRKRLGKMIKQLEREAKEAARAVEEPAPAPKRRAPKKKS